MHTESIAYEVAGARYVGYLAVDGSRAGKRPGVLVCHEGTGLHDEVKARARRLAERGYAAFALDYVGEGLACIGADDPMVPPEQRLAFEEEMRAAKVDWRLYLYGNAVHGFANPDAGRLGNPAVQYHAPSHQRSWRDMLDLFDETFGVPA